MAVSTIMTGWNLVVLVPYVLRIIAGPGSDNLPCASSQKIPQNYWPHFFQLEKKKHTNRFRRLILAS